MTCRLSLRLDRRTTAQARIMTVLLAVIASVIACVLPAPAAAAGPGRAFFGMQTWTFPNAQDVAMMKRGGVGTLRVVFNAAIGASTDAARWDSYDELMLVTAQARIRVLPVLIGNPGDLRNQGRPRSRTERMLWARFVSGVAARYGRGGAFWDLHPQLEPTPITAYQVWNEPNLRAYWGSIHDAAGYVRLVRLTSARLRAVDPKASIVLAGLPDSRHGTRLLDYIRAIYAQRGARALFDVVALNPYSADAAGVLAKLNDVRAYMNRRGDRRTPIWVTEVGWATAGPRSPFVTSKRDQAARVTQMLRTLIAARVRLRLGRVILFGLQDRAYRSAERPWWGPHVGLFDKTGRPKPAWRTFVGVTGGQAGGRLTNVAGRTRGTHP